MFENNSNINYGNINKTILRELKYDPSVVNTRIASSIINKLNSMGEDGFKQLLRDNVDGDNVLIVNTPDADPIIKGIFNRGFILQSIAENGSGFNDDVFFRKYNNVGGAIYDIFAHITEI